jgi:hypothetical protein
VKLRDLEEALLSKISAVQGAILNDDTVGKIYCMLIKKIDILTIIDIII